MTCCGSAIGWGSHDLLPDPGLAQPVSHVRGEAAVGQTVLGLGISHLTSWLKFLDTIELQMNVSEDFTITEREGPFYSPSGIKNLCYPNCPSLMTFALASQFHIYLPWVNHQFSIVS